MNPGPDSDSMLVDTDTLDADRFCVEQSPKSLKHFARYFCTLFLNVDRSQKQAVPRFER